ncbi:lysophospholipid acyltransferase family protein [Patulibacter defluvii]|uniref:lysophospholipid acyltransferase family protein n=1 Tax=Patulibacter defluvii TaxID=3095358 RepID=UPI002A75980A|nr:1-acyl-sn-glycerol-3-phosphate acyltransferase [Patulibacter sp. DM4]
MGPLLPDDGPRGARIVRRLRGIVAETIAFLLVTLLSPLLLLGAAIVDLALWLRRRKPWMAVRLLAMLWWFLLGDLLGLLQVLAIKLSGRDSARRRWRLYRLRIRWSSWHLAGIRVLFGLRFTVEGLDQAGNGPLIVLIRHASIIDNTLPDAIIGRAHGLGLRYVVKRELRMIPTLDLGGEIIPTYFVRRGSGDTARELEQLRKLAVDLGDDEGILLYPEGTRMTPRKLARAKEIVAERQPELAERAARFQHLLPPRLGGPLTVLADAPHADVVLCGHVGFDGFVHISDVWRGGLLGTEVRIRFWRYPAAELPGDEAGRTDWLYDRWLEVDAWVGEQQQRALAGGADPAAVTPHE